MATLNRRILDFDGTGVLWAREEFESGATQGRQCSVQWVHGRGFEQMDVLFRISPVVREIVTKTGVDCFVLTGDGVLTFVISSDE